MRLNMDGSLPVNHLVRNNMSLTIQGLLAILIGTIVRTFELDFDEGQVSELVSALILVGGFAASWIGRVRHGDITILGTRK